MPRHLAALQNISAALQNISNVSGAPQSRLAPLDLPHPPRFARDLPPQRGKGSSRVFIRRGLPYRGRLSMGESEWPTTRPQNPNPSRRARLGVSTFRS